MSRYYWLKMPKDFFNGYKLRILENMDGGREAELIYVKLLCEATSHEGRLRFSDRTPYTAATLAPVIHADLGSMEQALKLLQDLELLEVEADGTIVLPEVATMIGSASASPAAVRMRRHRENEKSAAAEQEEQGPEHLENARRTETNDREQKANKSLREYRDKSKEIRVNKNTVSEAAAEREFDVLWDLYPKKQGRKDALAAYIRARKAGTAYEDVARGIEMYKGYITAKKIEDRFVKQGSTFFRQAAWENEWNLEPETAKRANAFTNYEQRDTDYNAILAEENRRKI